MPENFNFEDFHYAIQDAMGWENSHLHQFFTADPHKRNSQYKIIGEPSPEMPEVLKEQKVKLPEYLKQPKDTVFYEYDFGDSWMHEIKLEKILPKEKSAQYPKLLEGANACPPEDCGGLWGYYELLDALENPKNPEHADMVDWMGLEEGEKFDPTAFNPILVNFPHFRKSPKTWVYPGEK